MVHEPISAWQFWDRAEAAKHAAQIALGERWDLKPGQTCRLIVPPRYRTMFTARGTKIRLSGDRRYPIAKYWPGGRLPPLVIAVSDYRWEEAAIPYAD
jgi:hypothetical protein